MHYVFLLNVTTDRQVEILLKKKYPETFKFYTKEALESDVSIENSGGKCIQGAHRQIILVQKIKGKPWPAQYYAALAHECLHATMHTFRERGVIYNEKSHNEHFTYYMDHLIAQAIENN